VGGWIVEETDKFFFFFGVEEKEQEKNSKFQIPISLSCKL